MDTSEWQMELLFQDTTEFQFTVSHCLRQLLSFNCFSQRMVILIYHDVPPHLLKIVDQLPTIACNVMRSGRGHTLSPTVTGGTWPQDITYARVKMEKGVGFEPGGEINSFKGSNNCMGLHGTEHSKELWYVGFCTTLVNTWCFWPWKWINSWTPLRKLLSKGGTCRWW